MITIELDQEEHAALVSVVDSSRMAARCLTGIWPALERVYEKLQTDQLLEQLREQLREQPSQ